MFLDMGSSPQWPLGLVNVPTSSFACYNMWLQFSAYCAKKNKLSFHVNTLKRGQEAIFMKQDFQQAPEYCQKIVNNFESVGKQEVIRHLSNGQDPYNYSPCLVQWSMDFSKHPNIVKKNRLKFVNNWQSRRWSDSWVMGRILTITPLAPSLVPACFASFNQWITANNLQPKITPSIIISNMHPIIGETTTLFQDGTKSTNSLPVRCSTMCLIYL